MQQSSIGNLGLQSAKLHTTLPCSFAALNISYKFKKYCEKKLF
jgi:hypothetical protein